MNAGWSDYRHNTKKNPENGYLKFLTQLTPSVEKNLNLYGFKYVYKQRNINALFSHCGS
jgi:hypothetical protein